MLPATSFAHDWKGNAVGENEIMIRLVVCLMAIPVLVWWGGRLTRPGGALAPVMERWSTLVILVIAGGNIAVTEWSKQSDAEIVTVMRIIMAAMAVMMFMPILKLAERRTAARKKQWGTRDKDADE